MDLKKVAVVEFVVVVVLLLAVFFVPVQEGVSGPADLPAAGKAQIIEEPDLCGNGVVDEGEDPFSCCADAGCLRGYECVENKCFGRARVLAADGKPLPVEVGDEAVFTGFRLRVDSVGSRIGLSVVWPSGNESSESLRPGEAVVREDVFVKVLSATVDTAILSVKLV
ncbi:MAG: hypothetical protein JW834_02530 [Candidatus Diapherotrites archaeon]|nr:hypothetical protein [Candidatus Diapherotrites archaeon]